MKKCEGFTLIELLITVIVMGILLALAVPNFSDFLVRNRLSGQVSEFMTAINYARSEAVKRAHNVVICKSSSGTACETAGVVWAEGWLVCTDINNDDDCADAGEAVLRVFSGLPDSYTLNTNSPNFANRVIYGRLGMVSNNSVGGTFVFCHDSEENRARAIVLTQTRPRIATDLDGDGIPEKQDGSPITNCESP